MLRVKHLAAKWVGLIALVLLTIASIMLWHAAPIYPDEIALRVQAGRYIQDYGMITGLYALCAERIQSVPWIFIPSAWLLSWADIRFSPVEARALPIVALIASTAMTAWVAIRNPNPAAALLISSILIGVAGSGLILVRHEVFIVLHVFFSVLALYVLKRNSSPLWWRALICGALVFSVLTASYVHPQGLLLMPLTAYLSYVLLMGSRLNKPMVVIWVIAFAAIAATTHFFFTLSCPEFPGIEAYWKGKVSDAHMFFQTDLWGRVVVKYHNLTNSFHYKDVYDSNYLPALTTHFVRHSRLVAFLNSAINIIVFTVVLLSIVLCMWLIIRFVYACIRRDWKAPVGLHSAAVFLMIVAPAFFYAFYDATHAFYRCSILLFLLVIALVVILSEFKHIWIKRLTAIIGLVAVAVCMLSAYANHRYFYDALKTHEGPSVSQSRDWKHMPSSINRFAQSCGIDLAQGRGIISDNTYEGVKHYHRIYPITYLGLQMSLTKIEPTDVLARIKPNYVLARCSEMQQSGIGWPYDKQEGDLCCKRFSSWP